MELSPLLSSFVVNSTWSANPAVIYGLQVEVLDETPESSLLGLRWTGSCWTWTLPSPSTTVCVIVTTKGPRSVHIQAKGGALIAQEDTIPGP